MTLTVYEELEQGTHEWLQARCGLLTASVIGQLITPKTVKVADNDTSRGLVAALAAERITQHMEDTHQSWAMLRGTLDEPFAREAYAKHQGVQVDEVGFMVRDYGDYSIGYSPDGLVGDDGLIEIKSRDQKIQLQTIIRDEVPASNMAQLQAGLLVKGAEWIDYVSYCGGMPLYIKRVYPDPKWQDAIHEAAARFEQAATNIITAYTEAVEGAPLTERIDHNLDGDMEL